MRLRITSQCKLQEYGVYVGGLIDGASRKVLRLVALTNKLPVTIYDKLFEPAVARYGLPDQLITDKGPEWFVAAFVCYLLCRRANRRVSRRRRAAHRCVVSTRNVSTTMAARALVARLVLTGWCARVASR